jgi:hypothetical protein
MLYKARSKDKYKNDSVEILARQAARWAAAAQQDESPLIALLHANYAAGYLWALLDISTDKEIFDTIGLDISEFKRKIINIQDFATKRVSNICPQFAGDIDKYLLSIAGDI